MLVTALLVVLISALFAYIYSSRRKELEKLSQHGFTVPETNIIFGNLNQTHFSGRHTHSLYVFTFVERYMLKGEIPLLTNKYQEWVEVLCWMALCEFKMDFASPLLTGANFTQNHLVQTEWIKKYGKVFGKYEGLKMRVVVADLDVINRMLIKDFPIFINRPNFGPSKTLVNMENQRWKDVRRILSPTFSSSKMKKMFEMMDKAVDLTMDVVREKAESGEGFDIYAAFQALTLDVIGRCALAMDIDCQKNDKNPVLELVRQFFQGKIPFFILLTICFPTFDKVFWTLHKKYASGPKIEQVVCKNIARVMEERRRNPEVYKKVVDVLQLLLEAQKHGGVASAADVIDGDPFKASVDGGASKNRENGHVDKTHVELDDEVIMQNAWLFLLAGYETTSNALAYTIYHLAKHPDIQEKIREEIRAVCGVDDLVNESAAGVIDYAVVNKLDYLQQVLDESMRVSPPVPLFVTRRCGEDYPIPDYPGKVVPQGAVVEIPVWHIHHDPSIYPDPDVFDPDRFSAEEKAKRHPMAFIPFGAGPRICIGMRFALLEAKLCLARLLTQFSFIPDEERFQDPLQTQLKFAILNPVNGVWIKACLLKGDM